MIVRRDVAKALTTTVLAYVVATSQGLQIAERQSMLNTGTQAEEMNRAHQEWSALIAACKTVSPQETSTPR
jgi:hypothetical protein